MGGGSRQPPGGEQPEEGESLASDAPRNGATRAKLAAGGAPSAYTNTRTPARGAGARAPLPTPYRVHNTCTVRGKCAPDPMLLDASDTTLAEPAAPRKTRPRSPTLEAAHEVIREGRRPPTGGRGSGLRPGDRPRAPRGKHARGTCAAGRQRARPLPRLEAGPLHRRRLVPQATPPTRPRRRSATRGEACGRTRRPALQGGAGLHSG